MDKGTNIQVVVRCRGRNEREKRENYPLVISTQGGREVHVANHSFDKVLGKTYTFDRVYGPEARQADIHDQVAVPLLEEVLMGYNCTLFAYGQTGTGKTFTMEGDLNCTHTIASENAGIIPRTLFRLFHTLENNQAEFSVRLSYLELYNEELRDLFSAAEDDHRKLRIFDDNTSGSTKKGVIIQGLEELPVHNAMDAIGLLQKGSERRRVAATKCNDKSSRSHAIFSITVHTKEATPEGEDLIKVGKLNLVDLAGSENIGRSGAENRRAREAGLINQSLLTLGRVINLLVEGVAYIPYRDSKLTRLLQDSLGGHTKTCIIATVAPTRMDMEETLSTLDYANRAKSIKNQPQVNQRMTKKALIKEYAAEVERLKRELLATREKNGIFLPPESYQQLLSESQNHKDSAHEIRAQLEKAEATLEASTARYTQCTELLERTTAKLHQTEQTLQETDEKLGTTTEHLEQARVSLNEQLALAEAYADGESHVDGVAKELLACVKLMVQDVERLHDKIERQQNHERTTHGKLAEFEQGLKSVTDFLRQEIYTYQELQTEFIGRFVGDLQATYQTQRAHLEQQFATVCHTVDQVAQKGQVMGKTARDHRLALQEPVHMGERIQATLSEELAKADHAIRDNLERTLDQLGSHLTEQQVSLKSHMEQLASRVGMAFGDLQQLVRTQAQEVTALGKHTTAALVDAQSTSSALGQALQDLAERERNEAEQEKQALVSQFTVLLENMTTERETRLQDRLGKLYAQEVSHREQLGQISQHTASTLGKVHGSLEKAGTLSEVAGQHAQQQAELIVNDHDDSVSTGLSNHRTAVQDTVLETWSAQYQTLQPELARLNQVCQVVTNHGTSLEQHIQFEVQTLTEQTQSVTQTVESTLEQHRTHVSQCVELAGERTANLQHAFEGFAGTAHGQLDQARDRTHQLTTADIQALQPTGVTPCKRRYEYHETWDRTGDSHKVIDAFYERQGKTRPPDTLSAKEVVQLLQNVDSPLSTLSHPVSSTVSPASDREISPQFTSKELAARSDTPLSLTRSASSLSLTPGGGFDRQHQSLAKSKRVASYAFHHPKALGLSVPSGNSPLNGTHSTEARTPRQASMALPKLGKTFRGNPDAQNPSSGGKPTLGKSHTTGNRVDAAVVAMAAKIPLPPSPLMSTANAPLVGSRVLKTNGANKPFESTETHIPPLSGINCADRLNSKLPKRTRRLRG